MTAKTSATSDLLSVSILAGPSARALLQDVVSQDACRFGLLTGSSVDSQTTPEQFIVEPMVVANGGGYNPGEIRAQIAAIAGKAMVDHLIIECDSKTHPIAFASLFLPDGGDGQRLSSIARLSSILLAIDSETLLSSILHGERAPGVASPCILADQVESADVVVLTGKPTDRGFILAQAVASVLNPRARILQGSGETTSSKLLDAGTSFDFEAAFSGGGWRKLMEEEQSIRRNDQGVTAFVYRARRPFHPEKFWNLLQSPFPGVFRAKGFFWLATRMSLVGGLNIAGSECHYSPAGQWWAANALANHSGHAEIPDRLKKDWVEPFGDRRQAMTFMGIDVNFPELSARLDACLLSESEMRTGEAGWAMLPDPFPAWDVQAHDHECDDHDCCHH